MDIRVATLEDVTSICELYNEFFEYNSSLQQEYYRYGKETERFGSVLIFIWSLRTYTASVL